MSSFGEELRRERELREISLREISEATKISLRYLEALEANEFGELPGGVFNRGFVRAFAQYIGVDPESMVTSYLMEEQTRQQAEGKQEDARVMRGKGGIETAQANALAEISGAQLRWGLAAVVAVVLLAGSLIVWTWLGPDDDDAAKTVQPRGNGPVAPAQAEPRNATGAQRPKPEASPSRDGGAGKEDTDDPPQTASLAPPRRQAPAQDDAPQKTRPEATSRPDTSSAATPERANPAPPLATDPAGDAVRTRIRIVRATNGRVNCDNTRIEMLAGVRPGTTVEFLCKRFLVFDIADAGAIEVGYGSAPPTPLGERGERLSAYRVDLTRLRENGVEP